LISYLCDVYLRTDMIKIGDKVRFLNSTGGGRVKEFQGKHTVLVEDENGFDFPILISECVVITEKDSGLRNTQPVQSVFMQPPPTPSKGGHATNYPPSEGRRGEASTLNSYPPSEGAGGGVSTLNSIKETPEGEKLSACIAFLPVDAKPLVAGSYEAWFVNDSNYFLYFTYLSRQNNSWTSRYQGQIEPNTKIFMEEFGKDVLNDLEHICIQLIAFKKDKPFGLKNALSVELRIDTVKFYKLHCFVENDFFDEDALIFPVVLHDIPERQLLVTTTELQEAMFWKKQDVRQKPQPAVKSAKKENPTVEIDLHINQLLDTTEGMSAGEILNYQMNKFHEVLKLYATKKGQKIVFIHGKGEGILRTAIEKELKTKYKSYVFQDASFQEYGFGATMVKIR